MLAPTPYLTAADLDITEEENAALVEVQRRLERGELKHRVAPDRRAKTPRMFNMNWPCTGSVACLGGWMALLMGYSREQAAPYVHDAHYRLRELFYPHGEPMDWSLITPKQTVVAIKHFRLTGAANEAWSRALGRPMRRGYEF